MLDKIKKQAKIIFVAIGIIVLFGVIGSGYYTREVKDENNL